ncbi:MAG: hypothetical protein LBQ79_01105, partial [Deltaproteobacteria bacterium]|nr:hypothetical protein [Deltaproteobacteria bacterium]
MRVRTAYVVFDFESYYNERYSLARMSTEAYCLDPRFQIIAVAVRFLDREMNPLDGAVCRGSGACGGDPAAAEFLKDCLEAAPDAAWVAHNAWFDGFILERILGIEPARIVCTAALSNWTGHSRIHGRSLKSLCAGLGVGEKGGERETAKGLRLEDFSPELLERYERYCMNDADLCAGLLKVLGPLCPPEA